MKLFFRLKKVDRSEVEKRKPVIAQVPVNTPDDENEDDWDDVTDWISEEVKPNLASKANKTFSKSAKICSSIRDIKASIQDENLRRKFDEVIDKLQENSRLVFQLYLIFDIRGLHFTIFHTIYIILCCIKVKVYLNTELNICPLPPSIVF